MTTSIGEICNSYGGLNVKEENGKFFWSIENYDGDNWEEITETLYQNLLVHEINRLRREIRRAKDKQVEENRDIYWAGEIAKLDERKNKIKRMLG